MAAVTKKASTRPQDNPDLVPIDSGVETWKNVTKGTVAINRLAEYGRKVTDLVTGGRTFALTPQERRMNQNAVALKEQDIFTNGTLQPVSLLDDEPDTETLRTNPNLLDDKDIAKLFRLRGESFVNRLGDITNPTALDRILEVARDPRHDVTLSQYEALKLRKAEIDGAAEKAKAKATPSEPAIDPNLGNIPKGVTPR